MGKELKSLSDSPTSFTHDPNYKRKKKLQGQGAKLPRELKRWHE